VIQAGGGAGLGEVGVGVLGAGDQLRVRHLDGHRALELVVAGQEDAAEATLAQEPLDAVAADVRREEGGRVGDGLPFTLRGGPQGVGAFVHERLGAGTTVVGSTVDPSRRGDVLPSAVRDDSQVVRMAETTDLACQRLVAR
jgi:hypothetical protein